MSNKDVELRILKELVVAAMAVEARVKQSGGVGAAEFSKAVKAAQVYMPLKGCPLCGTTPLLTVHDCGNSSDVWATIECESCSCSVSESACSKQMERDNRHNWHVENVLEVWNKRAS